MFSSRAPLTRLLAGTVAGVVGLAGLVGLATPAAADTSPVVATTPTTVAADSLPTTQIDGVVWQQAVAGSKVVVGGDFANARPAGAAAGTSTVPRTNLLAYDIETGVLDASWAPNPNAQVRAVAVSPDGSRIYVGGNFTTIAGQARYRIAAFDAATGALLTSFNAGVDSQVRAIVATNTTVYVGGAFTSANGEPRSRVAAFRAADGAVLPWNPSADNGTVSALTVSPDGSMVVVGGSFTTFNGSGTPGYGLARVDGTTGASLPLPLNTLIRDGGTQASITSLTSDGTSFYVTGYVFGSTGNLEGAARGDWATGSLVWVEDCHGDTYAAWPASDTVYVAGHPHYCGNVGGFPQTEPWSFYRALAFTKEATQTVTADPHGYFNFAGNPAPTLLHFYPEINTGTFTGQGQGPWTVTGNSDYVLYAGEFTIVNNKGQQGLARFARTGKAPNKQGPRVGSAAFALAGTSFSSGTARLSWPANYDRDNEFLTYTLSRNGVPVHTVTAPSSEWKRPTMGYLDSGLTPGTTYTYRLKVVDAFGNSAISDQVPVTVADAGAVSPYAEHVLADGASTFWRLGEASGNAVYDWVGFNDATAGPGVTRGAAGAINADTNGASTFDGTPNGRVSTSTPITGPDSFAVESWIRTTSTRGGKIIGFGSSATGSSGSYDRQVYMDNSGKIWFGVYPGEVRSLNTTLSYNDGQWHHVVASMGAEGMRLFIDGRRVAQRSDTTTGQAYPGYWRVGGDNLGGWPNQPTSPYLAGTIDDVAIYPAPLTAATVLDHWVTSGRVSTVPPAPADAYGAAVYAANPDLYWRLNESSGTVAADAGISGVNGTYGSLVSKGVAGALVGVANTAISTLGTQNSRVVSTQQVAAPNVYSQELWFRTSTRNGGKLIGFGSALTGTSANYDRHVYMETNGRLTFGTWTGVANTITSPLAYNNNQWHHLVATQSAAGMRLYVDGALVGTHPEVGAQSYSGYWRVGGDTTWGPQPWFAGQLDEVAVYSTALDAQTVTNHYALGTTGQLPNQTPAAYFTATPTDLTVALDATGSSDPDGTIASSAWTFGDGGVATGSTTSHTYAAPGTYTVTLTVTDDQGGTAATSQQVTVTAPNQPPVAAFTATPTELVVAVDAAGSSDPDGTVAGYAWSFGDGATATGPTASHLYATGGTKTVTLTVTDDDGAATTVTQDVVVVPPNVAPVAAITATTSTLTVDVDSAGSSDPDGSLVSTAWTFGDGGTATTSAASHTYAAPGTYPVTLTVTDDRGGIATATTEVTVALANVAPAAVFTATPTGLTVGVDATGSGDPDGSIVDYAWSFGDGGTASGLTASHVYASSGTRTVTLTVTDDDGATSTSSQDVTVVKPNVAPVAAFTSAATDLSVAVDASTSGDSDGTIASYAWTFGDEGTASGITATHTYAAAGTYTVTLTTTDDQGASSSTTHDVTVAAPVPNLAPVAAFTTTATFLSLAVDGSTSSDADGTVASYAWDFGDGATATGPTPPAHVYATAGSYLVSLTVTDDDGEAATTSRTVSVTAPPANLPFAVDAFDRTTTGGWGSAETGGAWTVTGGAANFSVTPGAAAMRVTGAGFRLSSFLPVS
ncbi:PKD domain-containing protein, partial [Cellulomonas terrae]|uniref:PKD domain-containing protein n=1 Tax=Cellulomonas terrae TaxID=311234 RepID=UPI0011BDD45F